MRWFVADIAEAVQAGLTRRAREDDAEHAVYGFDALDELGLHPLIAEALRAGGDGGLAGAALPGALAQA